MINLLIIIFGIIIGIAILVMVLKNKKMSVKKVILIILSLILVFYCGTLLLFRLLMINPNENQEKDGWIMSVNLLGHKMHTNTIYVYTDNTATAVSPIRKIYRFQNFVDKKDFSLNAEYDFDYIFDYIYNYDDSDLSYYDFNFEVELNYQNSDNRIVIVDCKDEYLKDFFSNFTRDKFEDEFLNGRNSKK